ncbi:hypothetical protein H6G33_34575 [Calothrix sp. FACHB-1219]|uniref:hypothetical protein n=1 Tax=unclassified Calothrix TaxID=2619626 RepID=UPI0016868655|nr:MULTISPECIES: hypothetical protein [unclassified Calothrix]MBD2203711.1 hypothetical protein [Calothrix sp. FACHB-168]MBD2222067.1 hypothetical protein [Calothrix sp. FACHB-1219]
MSKLKYWTLVTLDGTGNLKFKELQNAKSFFTTTFADLANIHEISDTVIQQRLLELSRNAATEPTLLAQRCLLCFISWQIQQACLHLARQFGDFHGFTERDLFRYVLDDDDSLEPATKYQSFAREVLQTFDPEKSLLTTWVSRKVKQHDEVEKFLLECGLYLVRDWAILNDTKPQQLAKILGEFHYLTPKEIEQAQKLLAAYHKVYRAERWQQLAQGNRSKCPPPTSEQLAKMAQLLESKTQPKTRSRLSPENVMRQLQNLADKLRQYRIHVRSGLLATESLDVQINENFALIEQIPAPDSDNLIIDGNDEEIFLNLYRNQILHCLDLALDEVTKSRVNKLNKKDSEKSNQFLLALQLFHCQRLSMSAIAKQLGLDAQYQVTRLLKLKEFRADVEHQTLQKLKEAVIQLAQEYSTPERLANLDRLITDILNEQITNLIKQAETEALSMHHQEKMSHFSQRLCQQLNHNLTDS